MEYKITKIYNGDVEFVYGDKVVMLTDKNKTIVITDDEYMSIPQHKMYLFTSGFCVVEQIEEVKFSKKVK